MKRWTVIVVATWLASVVGTLFPRTAEAQNTRYSIQLNKLPPSRVWCSLTSATGQQEQVLFDPLRGAAGLRADVSLNGGGWEIRCISEPAPQQIKVGDVTSSVDVAWVFSAPATVTGAATILATIPTVEPDTAKSAWTVNMKPTAQVVLEIKHVTSPSMAEAVSDLGDAGRITAEKRSLEGDVSALAKDTLEILAEIALERAKAKGARLVQQKLQQLVCDELKGKHIPALGVSKDDLLFPRLCAAIREVPLPELIESAAKVGRALEMDIAAIGFVYASHTLRAKLANNPSAQAVVGIVLNHVSDVTLHIIESGEFAARDAELLVLKLAQDVIASADVGCELKVVFAVAATCRQRPEGCSPGDVLAMLKAPEGFFSDGKCVTSSSWAQAANVVGRIIDVLDPAVEKTPRERYRTAIVVAFDLAARGVDASKPKPPAPLKNWTIASRLLEHSRDLTLGVFDHDARVLMTSGLAIVRTALALVPQNPATQKVVYAIDRLTPVVVVLTTNAESLKKAKDAKSDEEREALREARKRTLEALIDSATQRTHRGHEWVASLGANVGFRHGATFQFTKGNDRPDGDPNLSMPMGVAIQLLAPSKEVGWGMHFQGSIVDLAQFLDTTDEESVEWNDFVLIGGQVGPILGDADNAFSLAADVRYFPGGRLQGTWFFGAAISYYVPFFDFN